MDALETIFSRHSVRKFKDQPIEQEKIDNIVKAADCAPFGGTYGICVITCPDMIKCVNDAARAAMENSGNEFLMGRLQLEGYEPLYNPPLLLLFCAPRGEFGYMDCAMAAENAALAAKAQGLDSCFNMAATFGFQPGSEMTGWLEMPENFEPICGLVVGYADGNAFPVDIPRPGIFSYILKNEEEGCC